MQPETRFKEKVKRELEKIPDLWFEKIQQVVIRGTPDYIICYRGWLVAFELKVPPNDADTLQAHKLSLIDKAGGLARVVTPQNLDECLKELQCLPELKHGLKKFSHKRLQL